MHAYEKCNSEKVFTVAISELPSIHCLGTIVTRSILMILSIWFMNSNLVVLALIYKN